MRIITEPEFRARLEQALEELRAFDFKMVTGPGRSGAVASVYASHFLGIPWFPYGAQPPVSSSRLLIVDTAQLSGATLRKASRKYGNAPTLAVFSEPPRVKFWYEVC